MCIRDRLEGDLYGEYTLSAFEEYDHGFDFYAPQTYTCLLYTSYQDELPERARKLRKF